MDMAQDQGSVEVGAPEPQSTGATTICITIDGDKITAESYPAGGQPSGNAQPMDIGEALKMVLDTYESAETPESEDASFEEGLKGKSSTKPPKPTQAGMMMG